MRQTHSTHRQPLYEHVRELRKRVFISVLAIAAAGLGGYAIHEKLLRILQKPLGETLFYTSPTGGFSFVFKLCFFFGLVVSLPVVVYEISKFIGPAVRKVTRRTFVGVVFWSALLAAAGVLFAYFISLPAALRFLANFGGEGIESLITADEYFNFAMAYLIGFALLFQIPLITWFINRITPLKPGKMMRLQKWVVLASFVVAAVLTPTPDPFNQLLMAAPAILLYQLAIILVWLVNLRRRPKVLKPIKVPQLAEINFVAEIPRQIHTAPSRRPVLGSSFDIVGSPRSFNPSTYQQPARITPPDFLDLRN